MARIKYDCGHVLEIDIFKLGETPPLCPTCIRDVIVDSYGIERAATLLSSSEIHRAKLLSILQYGPTMTFAEIMQVIDGVPATAAFALGPRADELMQIIAEAKEREPR